MNDVCRLCLSVGVELVHKLYQNYELLAKISSCLQVELLKENSLPNQICLNCIETVNKMYIFMKTVIKNQNTLYWQLKSGHDCLEKFYHLLTDVKNEPKDVVEEFKEETDLDIKDLVQINDTVQDYDADNLEENAGYSSEDNVALITLKVEKADRISENTIKTRKKDKKKTLQSAMSKKNNTNNTTVSESTNYKNVLNITEYKCLMCLKIFDNRSILLDHYKNAHKPSGSKELPSSKNKSYSEIEVDGKKQYKCEICNNVYSKKKTISSHVIYKHQESRPYACSLCGRTYKLIPEIIGHLRAHSGTKLFCSHRCGYSTAYIGGLRVHEKQHKNEYNYKCEKCGKGFEVRSWYEDHRNVHTGAKPYVCEQCGAKFHCKRYLLRHRTTGHPAALTAANTRYICTQCSLPCSNMFALQTHLSEEHGIKRCFLCDECGKSFKTSAKLHIHKRCHLGVKNYKCKQCNKLFCSSSSLRRHELTHAGVKRHACAECQKRYTHKAALGKHLIRCHPVATLK